MKLSAPVFRLRRNAKVLSREEGIPLHEALDRIAVAEGFERWSLLQARYSAESPASKVFSQLAPGDILLLGARPGQGKTLLGLQLAVEAMKAGSRSVFFTLEFTEKECRDCFQAIGVDPMPFAHLFELDCSDRICADYIQSRLGGAARGTLVVVDYLQLLDQRRDTPELSLQVAALKAFAFQRGLIIVFISQIDRAYDPVRKSIPTLEDVRLPNPLDLRLFDKTCFMNDGNLQVGVAR